MVHSWWPTGGPILVANDISRDRALDIFKPLDLEGLRSGLSEAWGTTLELAPATVEHLLSELARRGVPEPEVGAELGDRYWRVEAVWPQSKVVLVDGRDPERDGSLTSDGFKVVPVAETDANKLAAALTG